MCDTKKHDVNKFLSPGFLMLLSVVFGIIAGFTQNAFLYHSAKTISALMISSLQLLSTPIIFVSVVATISGMRNLNQMQTIGFKVLKYTLITTILAAVTALVFFVSVDPVREVKTSMESSLTTKSGSTSYLSALLQMYPSNMVKAFAENNVMGVILIALFVGVATLSIAKEQKETINHLFKSLFSILVKMTQIVLRVLPIGIWAFVSIFIIEVRQGNSAMLDQLFRYIVCVFGATLFQGIVVLPVILKLKGISPIQTFKGMFRAISLAFFSKSSSATLPVTIKCAEENLKVSQHVASFSLPLCTTINMNGCAAFIFTTVLFVSMSNGMTFSPFDMVMWVFIATLAAIGNAGVPMGCYFLSGAFLTAMDVPLEMMGIILPIYTVMDMVETAVNVWSDGCVTLIVDRELSLAENRNKASSITAP